MEPEEYKFDAYSSTANLKVTVEPARTIATAQLGTTLTASDPDVTGRLIAELDVTHGGTHQLTGVLQPGWTIESVETVPADALREWFVDWQAEGGGCLDVGLVRAVRPSRRVTIIVNGRLQRPRISEPLSVATLGMVRWSNVQVNRHLLSIHAGPTLVVEPVGTLRAVAANEMDTADRDLFNDRIEGVLFDLTHASADSALRLATEQSRFTAELELDANCTGKSLQQSYRLALKFQNGRADRLLVYASEPLVGGIRWTEASSGAPLTAVRLNEDHPQRARLPSGGELWQLRLPHPSAGSMEIVAKFVAPWPSRRSLPLLSLPEAHEQRGRVLVRCEPGVAVVLEPSHIQPVELANDAIGRAVGSDPVPYRTAYRYEPADCEHAAARPQLLLECGPVGAADMVVVRHLELESTYSANGHASHLATFELENRGAASIPIQLAPGTELELVEVDSEPLSLPTPAEGTPFVVPMPRDRRFVKLVLAVKADGQPLAAGDDLHPPVLNGQLMLTVGEWSIRLPEEFSIVAGSDRSSSAAFDWRARLFGPLARRDLIEEHQENPALNSRLSALGVPGWQIFRIPFVARVPDSIVVTRPPLMAAWSLLLFLLSAMGGVRIRRWRCEWFILLTALLATICLLLPMATAPLASGALLGLLFSLASGWPNRVPPEDAPTATWPRFAVAGATSIAWLAVLIHSATGQAPAADATPALIHRILIPADPSGRIVGSKVYISERFFRELLPFSADSQRVGGNSWLLLNAAYQFKLGEQSERLGISAGSCSITLQIETLARDTTIELPFVRGEADWAAAALDGVPCELTWNGDGRGCRVAIGEPGRYEMRIVFQPQVRDMAARKQIGFAIPPLLGAELHVEYPAPLAGLNVLGALDAPSESAQPGRLNVELDATGRLVIDWPRQDANTADAQSLRIAEMRWLHLSEQGAVMDVKYTVEGARRPAALTLIADRHWQLLTDSESTADVPEVSSPDDSQSIRFALSTVANDRSQAVLRFRLTAAPPRGSLRLPPIELASLSAAQHWLAVSNDVSLECEIVGGGTTAARPVDEFLAAWSGQHDSNHHVGEADSRGSRTATKADDLIDVDPTTIPDNRIDLAPQLVVFADSALHNAWRVSVRPRRIDSAIDEAVQVAAANDGLRVQYRADVTPSQSHQFQLSLAVPLNLTIDQLTVVSSGEPLPIRWVRSTDREIQVYFSQEIAESYRLLLSGHAPLENTGPSRLPIVFVAGRDAPRPPVAVYRDEDVLVDVQGAGDLSSADVPLAESLPPLGNARPIGTYQIAREGADNVQLTVSPNLVATSGQTLTTLSLEEGRWWATWRCRLRVQRGTLDTLKLLVPASWTGPFESRSAAVIETSSLANRKSRLVVRLPKSLATDSECELEIRGPILPTGDAQIEAPNITPESAADWQNYVSLPTVQDSGPVAWSIEGARPAELPFGASPESRAALPDEKKAPRRQTYLVTQTPFRIAFGTPAVAHTTAAVKLADSVVLQGADNGQAMITRFVLVPMGIIECQIELPDNQQLAAVSLDGAPAVIRPAVAGRWIVQLGPPQLPQMLDVETRSLARESTSRIEFLRPELLVSGVSLPVDLSLWSIRQTTDGSRPRLGGAAQVSAAEQAALRLERLVSLIETSAPTANSMPKLESIPWRQAWTTYLASLHQRDLHRANSSAEAAAASLVTPNVDEQLTAAWKRFEAWGEQSRKLSDEPARGDGGRAKPIDEPQSTISDPFAAVLSTPDARPGSGPIYDWTYCVADGSAERLTMERLPTELPAGQVQVVALLAIVCLTSTSLWIVRQPAICEFLRRWPHAAGVPIGVAYGAFLWPAWLGWVIAGCSLLLAARAAWSERSSAQ